MRIELSYEGEMHTPTIHLLVKLLRQGKMPWTTQGNIQVLDREMMVKYKYLVVHLNSRIQNGLTT